MGEVVHGVRHYVKIFQKYDVLLVPLVRHQALGRVALIDCLDKDFQRSFFLGHFPDGLLPFVLDRSRTNGGVGPGLEHPQPNTVHLITLVIRCQLSACCVVLSKQQENFSTKQKTAINQPISRISSIQIRKKRYNRTADWTRTTTHHVVGYHFFHISD